MHFCALSPSVDCPLHEVWDVVDKGLARGGVARVTGDDNLEDAVAGLPPEHDSGIHDRSVPFPSLAALRSFLFLP